MLTRSYVLVHAFVSVGLGSVHGVRWLCNATAMHAKADVLVVMMRHAACGTSMCVVL